MEKALQDSEGFCQCNAEANSTSQERLHCYCVPRTVPVWHPIKELTFLLLSGVRDQRTSQSSRWETAKGLAIHLLKPFRAEVSEAFQGAGAAAKFPRTVSFVVSKTSMTDHVVLETHHQKRRIRRLVDRVLDCPARRHAIGTSM